MRQQLSVKIGWLIIRGVTLSHTGWDVVNCSALPNIIIIKKYAIFNSYCNPPQFCACPNPGTRFHMASPISSSLLKKQPTAVNPSHGITLLAHLVKFGLRIPMIFKN